MDATAQTDPDRGDLESAVPRQGDGRDDARFSAGERREFPRQLSGGPLWWKGRSSERFRPGLLIERSPDGAAFLARGRVTLLQGTRIQVSMSDPNDGPPRIEEGFVTRLKHVHADVFLVVTQLKPRNA